MRQDVASVRKVSLGPILSSVWLAVLGKNLHDAAPLAKITLCATQASEESDKLSLRTDKSESELCSRISLEGCLNGCLVAS